MTGTQPEVTAYLAQVRVRAGFAAPGVFKGAAMESAADAPRLLAAVEAALGHHQPGKLPWCEACGPARQPCQEVRDITAALLGEGER